ncbi:MAG: cation transporter [Planctomycetota bacterium]|nr:MAG: cation transporter [Planctomycetota bacterium]
MSTQQASHDHHSSAAMKDRRSLVVVLGIGITVLVVEVVGAYLSNSLALLADAGHVLTDVAGISMALIAIWIAARPASDTRTFGWYRAEIFAAVLNAVLLFGVAAFILLEAWRRLSEPQEIISGAMLTVAFIGGLANLVAFWILMGPQKRSLNMRGAYLEVLGDLLGSIAVVVAGVIVLLTGLTVVDAIASVIIALMILPRTWSLLHAAVDVLMQATPRGIRLDEVRQHILGAEGVADVHDLHAWTITSGMPVLSAHVVLEPDADSPDVLDELCRCLSGDFDIEHSTFQLESPDRSDLEEASHA